MVKQTAEYQRVWHKANPEKASEYGKVWRKANPEKVRKLRESWRIANREKIAEYNKVYAKENPGKIKGCTKRWQEAHPNEDRKRSRIYRREHPEYLKNYARKNPEKIRMYGARRRNYGYNILNVYFPGSVGHHVNDIDVVFIPEDVHVSCLTGSSQKEYHRELVMNYYGDMENMIGGIALKNICGG